MSSTAHVHGAQCACAHHPPAPSHRFSFAALLPALSCAVCPACMALWKPLLSVLGVTLAFNDTQHAWLLFGSLAVAVVIAAWDLWRSGVKSPFVLTLLGAALMLASHLLGDVAALEWGGMLVMLGSVPARMWARAKHGHHHAATA